MPWLARFQLTQGSSSMYPVVSADIMSHAVQIVACCFTLFAAFASYLFATRI